MWKIQTAKFSLEWVFPSIRKTNYFNSKIIIEKLFYLLFRTIDESSIQEGGKVTITNSSIFSDRMDIFWLSVFVKLFKRKVKFQHNPLHAQPYILLRTSTCAAHTCVDHKIDFSFCIVNNAHSFIISIHSESSSPYSRACNMLYRYVGLILPPPSLLTPTHQPSFVTGFRLVRNTLARRPTVRNCIR